MRKYYCIPIPKFNDDNANSWIDPKAIRGTNFFTKKSQTKNFDSGVIITSVDSIFFLFSWASIIFY